MSKKRIIIIVVVLILVALVGYFIFWSGIFSQPDGDMGPIVNQGVLPSLGDSTNPMKNKPDINPIDASNPFRSIKTNPFE